MTTFRQSAAYVDTTALLPVDSGERPVAQSMRRRLDTFTFLLSANLLEAEMRAALAREQREFDDDVLSNIRWIMPNRRLDVEMATVLGVAYLDPTRLWHLATALFFAELVPGLVFVTLDEQQETAARDLGFAIA